MLIQLRRSLRADTNVWKSLAYRTLILSSRLDASGSCIIWKHNQHRHHKHAQTLRTCTNCSLPIFPNECLTDE
jgi:hypothetical protein